MTKAKQLVLCPFCPVGTKTYFAVREVGWLEDREKDHRVVVVCSSCGAQGPAFGVMSFNTESTALQYWNTRVTQSPEPPQSSAAETPFAIEEFVNRVWKLTQDRDGWSIVTLQGLTEALVRGLTHPEPPSADAEVVIGNLSEFTAFGIWWSDLDRSFRQRFLSIIAAALTTAQAKQREVDAEICEGLVTYTEDHGNADDPDEPCKWCEGLEAAATAIRAGGKQ